MPKSIRPRSQPLAADMHGPGAAWARIDRACRLAVAGKLALREIAAWVDGAGVSDTEFRLLWLLAQQLGDDSPSPALDQSALAERLAVSAAQVSAVIERLRCRELIALVPSETDRRRQLWRLAPAGQSLVRAVTAKAASTASLTSPDDGASFQWEDAA